MFVYLTVAKIYVNLEEIQYVVEQTGKTVIIFTDTLSLTVTGADVATLKAKLDAHAA